jgi:hypothetical protein
MGVSWKAAIRSALESGQSGPTTAHMMWMLIRYNHDAHIYRLPPIVSYCLFFSQVGESA